MPLGSISITQSFLDRCLDDDPKNQLERPLNEVDSIDLFKKSVSRDLETLLNTRKPRIEGIERYAYANKSILNYGISEFSDINSKTVEGQNHIRSLIKSAIDHSEPRLSGVEVSVVPATQDGKLGITIFALLMIEPIATPISYDATLDTKTQRYRIGT